jgi:hypothetical protein
MTRRTATLLLLCLAGCADPAPKGDPPAEATAEKPPASDVLEEGDRLFGERRYVEAHDVFERAALAAEREGDRRVQVEALAMVARTCSLTERLSEGRGVLERAGALARPTEPLGWTRYLGVRGVFEREEGDRAQALATFVDMYDFSMAGTTWGPPTKTPGSGRRRPRPTARRGSTITRRGPLSRSSPPTGPSAGRPSGPET